MTDAEATIKHAIFSGIVDVWYKQDAEEIKEKVFERLFEPQFVWAIKEHIKNIEPHD